MDIPTNYLFRWWGVGGPFSSASIGLVSFIAVLIFPTLLADIQNPIEGRHRIPTGLTNSYLTPVPSIPLILIFKLQDIYCTTITIMSHLSTATKLR